MPGSAPVAIIAVVNENMPDVRNEDANFYGEDSVNLVNEF